MTKHTKNLINIVRLLSIFLLLTINLSLAVASDKKEATVLKMAILDTGFCPNKLIENPNIKVLPPFFPMGEFPINCNAIDLKQRRFHGHKVLEVFIQNYKGAKKIEILPVVVFDQNGISRVTYWKEAMPKLMSFKIREVLSATGVPLAIKIQAILPKFMHFTLASGRVESSIKNMVALFPQDYLPKKQVTIVGSQVKFAESTLQDPSTYKPENVNVWIDEDPNEEFKGSSRAVAIYLAKKLSDNN